MKEHEIREGMRVRTPDGALLGRVTAVGETHFEVEPGLLRPEDFDVSFELVGAVLGEDVMLLHGWDDLVRIEDDDGSALPPRRSENMDAEPLSDESAHLY